MQGTRTPIASDLPKIELSKNSFLEADISRSIPAGYRMVSEKVLIISQKSLKRTYCTLLNLERRPVYSIP
jgi:hypothetical protein